MGKGARVWLVIEMVMAQVKAETKTGACNGLSQLKCHCDRLVGRTSWKPSVCGL